MFDTDTNFGYFAIALLLFRSQFLLARLFFGCSNLLTLGSYP